MMEVERFTSAPVYTVNYDFRLRPAGNVSANEQNRHARVIPRPATRVAAATWLRIAFDHGVSRTSHQNGQGQIFVALVGGDVGRLAATRGERLSVCGMAVSEKETMETAFHEDWVSSCI
jgi:hypothetical protein